MDQVSFLLTPLDSKILSDNIKSVKKKLAALTEQIDRLGFIRSNPVANESTGRREQSYSFVPEKEVIGRDDDTKKILEMLLDSSNLHQGFGISVISIVGLGGVGKTTVAQLVFHHDKVTNYFDLKLWACLSDMVCYKDILKKIVESAVGTSADLHPFREGLEMQLQKIIADKLFLLVLDDLSIIDDPECLDLLQVLACGARGSKLLVTTQSDRVARAVGTSQPYMLRGLSFDDSWALFRRLAFASGESVNKSELEDIGKEIVKKCENVPLVIKMVANLLYLETDKDKWLKLNEGRLGILDIISRRNKADILNVWRRSYNELPRYLKLCFTFCSLFPKDHEFSKHDLILLWTAQGFLVPVVRNATIEDIGEDCFLELIGRGFFQVVKSDTLGNIVSCRMHNLVHHLARSEAGEESVMALSDFTEFHDSTLHVSVGIDGKFPKALFEAPKIRTLLWLNAPSCGAKLDRSVCYKLISKFRCLRALDLHKSGINKLPNQVGNLIHLRYLDVSKNDYLMELPKSITKLHNLQTLKLNCCRNLIKLPNRIGNLVMLRCLEIDDCDGLSYMPLGLRKLTCLQSLNRFVVCTAGSNVKVSGGLRVLNTLDNLGGRLKIELSGQWSTLVQEAPEARLRYKSKLTDLKIEWKLGGSNDIRKYYYYGALLENLQPPPDLKVLCIEGYRGKDFPSWAKSDKLASLLPKLVIISMEGCKECKHLPPFGQLKFLKCLTLRHMEGVEYVENGTYVPSNASAPTSFFRSLEQLTLHSFYNLKAWWKEVDVTQLVLPSFARLSKLKILNCPKLTSMPLFPCAEEVDFQNVNHKLLEVSTIMVAASASVSAVPSSSPSSSRATSANRSRNPSLSRAQSSRPMPRGWLQNLPILRHLHIKNCSNMKTFPIVGDESGGTFPLRYLVIDKCDSLSSLTEGLRHLNLLEELEISRCKDKSFWGKHKGIDPWSSLTSLRSLILREIPRMETLPEGLRKIRTIKSLSVATCGDFTALPGWIDELSSLQQLRIEGCPKITSLPSTVRGLKNLVKLEITECPLLIERCREQKSEDWLKISHIPRVLLHKSWRYGLLNDAQRIPISAATPS